MKKSTWLLVALAALVALGAWRIWDLGRSADPSELLTQADLLAEGSSAEQGLALRKLDRALSLAEDEQLRRTILDHRARLLAERGAVELALVDLRALIEVDPDDVALRIRHGQLTERAGETAAARAAFEQILDERPNHGWTRTLLADVERDQAVERMDALEELLAKHLDSVSLAHLMPDVDRITCLPPGDPLRAGLEASVLAQLPPDARLDASAAMGMVGAALEQVRGHYADSMASSVNPRSLFGMIDLLHRSGRIEETIDFGLAVADVDAAVAHGGTLQRLALALETQGRPRGAAAVVADAVARDPLWHVDFLSGWCEILYRAESWQRLENAAIQLGRSAGTVAESRGRRNAAFFFQGMAGFHLGRPDAARQNLTAYVAARPDEPVPGAIGTAWMTLAELEEQAGRKDAAFAAYRSCTRTAPLHAAEPWLILADRRAGEGEPGMAEAEALAMAIAAAPARSYELRPRLREAIDAGMASTGRDLGLIREQLRANGRWYPEGRPNATMLLGLTWTHLESNDPDGAALTARRLLRDLPEYPPALDALALAQLVQGRDLERFETLLRLVEAAGPLPEVMLQLEDARQAVPTSELPAGLLVRWMRADPDFTGTMELARGLAEEGRTQDALVGMAAIDPGLFDDGDRLLYAELLLEIGQPEGVLAAVEQISSEGPLAVRAALLQLLAGTALGRSEVLDQAMAQLDARLGELSVAPDRALVDACLEALLEARLGPAVLRFTTAFAETPLTRDGRRLIQAAMAELLYGETDAALAWLDRAEAFLDDGSPLVGRLALAIAAGDDAGRVDLARELRNLSPAWGRPHHAALLAGLEGRRGEAEALAAEALAEPLPGPRAHLVAAALGSLNDLPPGTPDELGKPLGPEAGVALATLSGLPAPAGRQVLLLLLALDCPDWDAWGLERLGERTNRLVLGPFATMLAVDHAIERDQLDRAAELLAQGRKRWAGFLPFWDQAEDLGIARLGRSDHPELAGLRRQRRAAGVPPRDGVEPGEAELAVDRSLEAGAQGRTDEALAQARAARDLAPDDLAVLHHLARTAQAPAPALAVSAWYDLLMLEPTPAPDLVAEARTGLVAALDLAGEAALSEEHLAELTERHPDSPLLAVLTAERLALELGDGANDRIALLGLMDDFLAANRDVVLDALEPGAAERWFAFLERYDPARALDLALHQRDLAPRHLESWTLVARGLEAVGQRREALEAWRTLARMTTTPAVTIEAAAWLAELGGSHEEVTELLNRASRAPDAAQRKASIEFVRGRSLANIGRDYLDRSLEVFEALYQARSTPGLDRSELIERLGVTYLQRGAEGDGARAKPLLEKAAEATEDPLRRDLFRALANLAPQLEVLRKAQGEAPEPTPEG